MDQIEKEIDCKFVNDCANAGTHYCETVCKGKPINGEYKRKMKDFDEVEKELYEQIKNEGYAFEEAAFEMARIEDIGPIFYYVGSNDHNPPHFHFRKKLSGQGKYLEGRILFEKPFYLRDKTHPGALNHIELRDLCKVLKSKVPGDPYERTYWQEAVDNWNRVPGGKKLPVKRENGKIVYPPMPEYRTMKPEGDL